MKLAITGASGFIGRHVLAALDRQGLQATLLLRGTPEGAARSRHTVVAVDYLDETADLYVRAGRPDVLLHLAWGGLPHYHSLHHVETERPAQYRMLKAMVRSGLPKLVVAGTCFEYGLQSGPLAETLPCNPVNAYSQAKDALRRELELLRREQPFQLTWARLFYLYGEGQSPNSLWSSLHSAAARGDAQFPMSGGEQLRDYLSASEAAGMLLALAQRLHGDGIVNVCSGKPVSVRALVEGWISERGWVIRPELGRHAYSEHEAMAFWGDAAKLRQCLQPL